MPLQQKDTQEGVYTLITPKDPKQDAKQDPNQFRESKNSSSVSPEAPQSKIKLSNPGNERFNKEADIQIPSASLPSLSLQKEKITDKPLDKASLNQSIDSYRGVLKELQDKISKDPKVNNSEYKAIEGLERMKAVAQNEDTLYLNTLSRVTSVAQSPYRLMHNLSSTFDWGIFKEKPITLVEQHREKIKVIDEDIDFRINKIDLIKKSVKQLTNQVDRLELLSNALLNLKDPTKVGEVTKQISIQHEFLNKQLATIGNIDNIAGKNRLSELNRQLETGFSNLDKQLEYAESTVKGAEKAALIGVTLGSGGAAAPILKGSAMAVSYSIGKNTSHVAGDYVLGNSRQTSFAAEMKDDFKDVALYTLGNGLSTPVVALGSKTIVSSGTIIGKVLPGPFATIAMRPSSTFGIAIGRPLLLGGKKLTEVGGGVSKGIVVEAPAAFYDSLDYKNTDPTGALRATGKTDGEIMLKYLTTRLCTTGSAAAFSHGFQGIRGNTDKVVSFVTNKASVKFGAKVTTEALVGVPELAIDVLNGLYIERSISPWLFGGKTEPISNDMIQQIIMSSFTGHMVGRSQDAVKNKYNAKQVDAVKKGAELIQNEVKAQPESIGLSSTKAPIVITSLGKNGEVQVIPDQLKQDNIITHLGSRADVAEFTALEHVHRLKGQGMQSLERELSKDGRVSLLNDLVNDTKIATEATLKILGDKTGSSTVIQNDRKDFQNSAIESFRNRAHSLAEIDLQGTSDKLVKYIQSYLNERKAPYDQHSDPTLGKVRQLWNNLKNPTVGKYWHLVNHLIDPMHSFKNKQNSKVVDKLQEPEDLKPDSFRSLVDSATIKPKKVEGSYIEEIKPNIFGRVVDSTAGFIDKYFIRIPTTFFTSPMFTKPIGFVNQLILRPAINGAIGFMSLPNSNIYPGFGTVYGVGQAVVTTGILAGKYTGASIASVAMLGSRATSLDRLFPNVPIVRAISLDRLFPARGRAYETGFVLARKAEGEVLLEKLNDIVTKDPSKKAILNEYIVKLNKENIESTKLLVRANQRTYSVWNLLNRVSEYFSESRLRVPFFSNKIERSVGVHEVSNKTTLDRIESIYKKSFEAVFDLKIPKVVPNVKLELENIVTEIDTILRMRDLNEDQNLKNLLDLANTYLKIDSATSAPKGQFIYDDIMHVLNIEADRIEVDRIDIPVDRMIAVIKASRELTKIKDGTETELRYRSDSFYGIQQRAALLDLNNAINNEINLFSIRKNLDAVVDPEVDAKLDAAAIQNINNKIRECRDSISSDALLSNLRNIVRENVKNGTFAYPMLNPVRDHLTKIASFQNRIIELGRDGSTPLPEIQEMRSILGDRLYLSICERAIHSSNRIIAQRNMLLTHQICSTPLLVSPELLRSIGRAPKEDGEKKRLRKFVSNFVSDDKVDVTLDKFIESKGLDFQVLFQAIHDLRTQKDPIKKAEIENKLGDAFVEFEVGDNKRTKDEILSALRVPPPLYSSGNKSIDSQIWAALKKGWGNGRPDLPQIFFGPLDPLSFSRNSSRRHLEEEVVRIFTPFLEAQEAIKSNIERLMILF